MRSPWPTLAALLCIAHASHADMRQTAYSEAVNPTDVRVSGLSPIAGFTLASQVENLAGQPPVWVKLPAHFKGKIDLEVTTQGHEYQAVVQFMGDSPGGWEKLSVDPSQVSAAKLADQDPRSASLATRAWITPEGDSKKEKRIALTRWGGDTPPPAGFQDKLRVQLNLGNASEGKAWLKHGKTLVKGDCTKPAAPSDVFFRWSCDFDPGALNGVDFHDASVVILRRESDGRQKQQTIEPVW